MPVIDYGGEVIPWYDAPIIGATNFTWQPIPPNPSPEEIQKYINNKQYQQMKMREGSGWFNDFMGNVEPIKIAAMVAASAAGMPQLIPVIAGADTAIKGGSPEDILKSAAISYVTQAVGGEIAGEGGFSSASETGLPTLAGEGIAADVGATLLNEAGTTGLDTALDAIPIDQAVSIPDVVTPDVLTADDLYTGQAMTDLSATSDTTKLADLVRAYETPTELTPTLDPNLIDVAPNNIPIATPEPTPTYDFSPEVPIEQVSPEYDPTSYANTFQPAPVYDFSPETPVEQVSPELDTTGTLSDSLNPTLKDVYKTLKTANTVRKILTPQEKLAQTLKTPLQTAQASQQQTNLANVLRGTQLPQTALPAIYKQANPFNFGQQNQPVQDTNALANLLRTA